MLRIADCGGRIGGRQERRDGRGTAGNLKSLTGLSPLFQGEMSEGQRGEKSLNCKQISGRVRAKSEIYFSCQKSVFAGFGFTRFSLNQLIVKNNPATRCPFRPYFSGKEAHPSLSMTYRFEQFFRAVELKNPCY